MIGAIALALAASPAPAQTAVARPVGAFGIPVDFICFTLTLTGVALLHAARGMRVDLPAIHVAKEDT